MNAIEVSNATKIYKLYSSPKDRLREIFSFSRRKFHQDFFALHNVSFSVKKGENVGIIGQNGSGKSTLLQIICGVLQPTSGHVHIAGRIAALLELGAGFNPEFTGRENVYMNGALMGFSREEMEKRSPDIEAFAEIGEYFDQPVRTYSSGMFVRLALAAAVNIDPEILVVDEALSVGDMYFQHRCISKMESFKAAGKTILLVTHDVNLVKTFCSSAILLNEGKILAQGDPEYVTEQYFMITKQRQVQFASTKFQLMQKSEPSLLGSKIRFGSEAGHIVDVRILDKEFKESVAFLAGDRIVIRIQVQVDPNVKIPNVGFILRDQRGYNIYGTDTQKLGVTLELDENHQATVLYTLSPVLAPGSYSFVVRLDDYTTPKINMLLDKQVGVGAFQVIENKTKFFGIVNLKAEAYQDMPERERRDR